MSAAGRQRTCAACGGDLEEGDRVSLEPLIDQGVRYIAVHWGCSTFARSGDVKVGTVDTPGMPA